MIILLLIISLSLLTVNYLNSNAITQGYQTLIYMIFSICSYYSITLNSHIYEGEILEITYFV